MGATYSLSLALSRTRVYPPHPASVGARRGVPGASRPGAASSQPPQPPQSQEACWLERRVSGGPGAASQAWQLPARLPAPAGRTGGAARPAAALGQRRAPRLGCLQRVRTTTVRARVGLQARHAGGATVWRLSVPLSPAALSRCRTRTAATNGLLRAAARGCPRDGSEGGAAARSGRGLVGASVAAAGAAAGAECAGRSLYGGSGQCACRAPMPDFSPRSRMCARSAPRAVRAPPHAPPPPWQARAPCERRRCCWRASWP